jgi:starch synthase
LLDKCENMARPLSVLYVTSELFPFVKIGGIADISYSLPLALKDEGYDIRVMLPKYGNMSERKNRIHEINRLRDLEIPLGKDIELATVKSSSVANPRTRVQAYITTNQNLFDQKKGIYTNPKTGEDYPDNDLRFIFFNRTVIQTCLTLNWAPDIIHCNDWQSGMIPAYVKTIFKDHFKNTKVIFTIHNSSSQGEFSLKGFAATGLDNEVKKNYTHKKKFNFLKGGLYYADQINTVSPTHAQELLQDKKFTNGLSDLLLKRKDNFTGILNGIDKWSWNPATDSNLADKYENNFSDFKKANKKALLKRYQLSYKEDIPVIGMISRLDEIKGIQLLIDALEDLMAEDIILLILGDGKSEIKSKLKELSKIHSKKFGIKFIYDEKLAHQIEAGSDFFLIPSIYEPCGLNAMYSLKYGSIPIVRKTGGLIDNVKEYTPKTKKGNGFVFSEAHPKDLVGAVKRAVELYKKSAELEKLATKNMEEDYSWDDRVEEYGRIYHSLIED